MNDPKLEALRYHWRSLWRSQKLSGMYTPAEALAELHRTCDQLWPPAVIITRYGARRANP